MDALSASLSLSGAGMRMQAERMRIVSENVANAQSTGQTPGAEAFRRKLLVLGSARIAETGHMQPEILRVSRDPSPFRIELDPAHPAADADGRVLFPNVNPLIELADMREAARTYEANLQMVQQARQMIEMTLDLLRQG